MEKVTERAREAEPTLDPYDASLRFKIEMSRRRKEGKVLLKAQDTPWRQNRHGFGKTYSNSTNWPELAVPGWSISRPNYQHEQYKRGKHTHRGGGRLLFCLEGKGRTINNGINLDWEAGDLELLPVTRTENSHQHFNMEMGKPCGQLVLMFWPFMEATANETRQVTDAPAWKGEKKEELYRPDDFVPDQALLEGYPIQFSGPPTNLLDDILLRRNKWREYMSKARWIIKEKDQPLETNRNGIYRWYIHPSFQDVAMKQILFWTHEIPPASRSGKQKLQGGRVHFVLSGRGYTVINGKRYDWGPEDVILSPIIAGGVVMQHFNADPLKPAKLACAEPNWFDIIGVDMACGFEILEDCPEWKALQKNK
ncbi:MAG: hypothetical protein HY673_01355 [Chloroflexi bacterium]|nr:hypothetical protein [Chloroflexota bacterium]